MKAKGFTLIELLVVIAIISLLMSILVPSLRRVKENARELVCKTNQRQIGYAMIMYTDSTNEGKFPYQSSELSINALKPTGNDSWCRQIGPYLGETKAVFSCPTAKFDKNSFNRQYGTWEKEMEPYLISYLYNGACSVLRPREFDRPSEKIIVHDWSLRGLDAWVRIPATPASWNDYISDCPNPYMRRWYSSPPDALEAMGKPEYWSWNRHLHGKNVWGRNLLMMDGHVEWHKWPTCLDSYLPRKELRKLNYRRPF